jgi:hypothetical protein
MLKVVCAEENRRLFGQPAAKSVISNEEINEPLLQREREKIKEGENCNLKTTRR